MNDRPAGLASITDSAKNPEILLEIAEKLETERLLLRCPLPGDGKTYKDFADECFEDTKRWFGPWAKEKLTGNQCEELVRKMQCEFLQRSELNYLCFHKKSGHLVGRVFVSRLNWTVPKGMLGYWTRPSHQKNGLGEEAVAAIKRLVFQSLHFMRLEIHIDPANEVSKRFAEKCGFKFEGRLRNFSFDNGGTLHDYWSYSLIPADLEA